MLDDQNTLDDPTKPGPGQQTHGPQSANNTLDTNPTLAAEIQQALTDSGSTPDPTKPPPSGVGGLWQRIKAGATNTLQSDVDLENAATRGVLQGANSISNTVVGAAAGVAKATGLYKLATPERQQAFLKWYDQRTSDVNPIQIPQDTINKWYGPSQGGLPGFVENASQFATGLAAAGEVLPIAGATGKAKAALTAAKGALADISAFDPYKKRLSNMIQNGPSWLSNPLTAMLAAKDDDSEAAARFKQAAEGIISNSAIEAITHGVRWLRAGDNTEEAATHLQKATTVSTEPAEGDVAKVVPTENAKATIVPAGYNGHGGGYLVPAESGVGGGYTGFERRSVPRPPITDGIEKGIDPAHTFTQGEADNLAASFNYIAKNHALPTGTLSDEDLTAFSNRMKAYADGTDKRSMEQLRDQYGINVNYTQSPDDVVNTIKSMVDVMPDPSAVTRDIPRTHADISAAAQDMFKDMSGDEVLQHAARVFGNTRQLPEQITAMREWMYAQATQTQKLSQMVEANPNNSAAMEQLGQSLDTMLDFHAHLTGTNSNVARALGANQIPVGQGAEDLLDGTAKSAGKDAATDADANALEAQQTGGQAVDALTHRAPASPKATAGLTPLQIRSLARSVFLTGNEDPAAVLALIRGPKVTQPVVQALDKTGLQKFGDFAQAYRINAMLSGPKTQLTKVASDFMTMMQRPAEYWWGGLRGNNPALRQMGSDMYAGFFPAMRESWNAAAKAFKTGTNILAPESTHTGALPLNDLTQPSMFDAMSLPSRFLMTTDEFAKQMNYRMNMRAQILRQARAAGITDPTELAERANQDIQWAFDPQGGAINPIAKEYAKQNTFTNDLRPGSIQKWVQDVVNAHPTFKAIMPFVRTPMNLFNFAWERTPFLNRLNKDFADEMSGKLGPEAQQLAKAKQDFGTAAYGSAAALSLSGNITGGGPKDPKLHQAWLDAGHQPYSIRVPGTNQWMSYRRANPISDQLGLVADLTDLTSDSKREDWEQNAAAATAALISNVSSKTFMQGWSSFMDAVSSGRPDKVQALRDSFAGTFIPNAANEMNSDQHMREARGLVDKLAERTPGWSTTLEPRRNLLGEQILRPPGYFQDAINPFTMAPGTKPDDVLNEIVKLGKGFSMPAEKRNNGMIDLTDRSTFNDGPNKNQSPYDRMLELMGNPSDGSKSLRDQLTDLVQSPAYQKAPAEDAQGPGGLRWKMMNDYVQGAQEKAWGQVLKEYPSLKQAVQQSAQIQGAGIARGKAGADSVRAQFQQLFPK